MGGTIEKSKAKTLLNDLVRDCKFSCEDKVGTFEELKKPKDIDAALRGEAQDQYDRLVKENHEVHVFQKGGDKDMFVVMANRGTKDKPMATDNAFGDYFAYDEKGKPVAERLNQPLWDDSGI